MVSQSWQSRRVDDRYDLVEPLGRGGMGVVWLAEDNVLQRRVAVKQVEFPPGIPAEEIATLRQRVLREARSAGRLNHPNVTTIFDVVTDEGTTWIVMEYVDAPTLTDLVSQQGPLTPARAAEVGLDLLSALEAAHAAGIVHRDVKPANVMVPAVGNVKLADFGVAAMQGDPKLTLTGLIIGSPSFMAPEQAQEGVSTTASDMWGLGATLYYAVEGEPPFDRGTAIPTLAAVAYEPPRTMQRAGVLGPVITRLLAKDPDERPVAGELAAALRQVVEQAEPSRTVVLDPTPPATAPLHAAADGTADDWPDERAPRRQAVWPWLLAAALLLVFAVTVLPDLVATDAEPAGDEAAREQADARPDPEGAERSADDAAGDAGGGAQEPARDEPPAEEADPEQPAEPDTGAQDPAPADEVPQDWATHEVAGTGTTVAYPSGWTKEDRGETMTDFLDPDGDRYLRVDYTDSPGEDAVADWERQSDAFAQSHEDYTEIAIEPYDYPGADTAALWEYTYSEGGAQLHAYNLAIVIGGRGYALNLQTHEERWAESQPLWEQIVESFDPAT